MFEQIPLDGLAVVHIHEFARNQPTGDAVVGHPGMGLAEEMAVEPGKPADLHAAGLLRAKLQAALVAVLQVMVPHIWRIADDEIKAGHGFCLREV